MNRSISGKQTIVKLFNIVTIASATIVVLENGLSLSMTAQCITILVWKFLTVVCASIHFPPYISHNNSYMQSGKRKVAETSVLTFGFQEWL